MGQEVPATADDLTPELAPEDTASAFVRHTAVMSVGTTLSRVTGFLRLSAMAYAIGIVESRITDAYNIANTTPNIIYELALGGILSSVFVPVFVEWLRGRGQEEAWDVARRVMTIAVLVLSAIALAGILAAPLIIRLYTVGATPAEAAATRALGSFFLRWFMPQIVFYGVGAVATGLLNAHHRFAAPMFAPILNNLIAIATFATFAVMSGPKRVRPGYVVTGPQKLILAVGTTLGVLAMTAALWPSLRRLGFRFRWRSDWRHEAVRRIAHLAKWTVVYVAVNQIGYLIVILLAAGHRGDYSAYVGAFILFQLPHAIFAVSIFTALLPAMSGRWADRDRGEFRALLAQGIRATAFIVIPAAMGYLVLAKPIVRLLLQHGRAGTASTDRVASILVFFAIGLFAFSTFQLLLRAFYSMQDTRTPALINVAAVGLNTAVNFLYFFTFGLGVRGLALGHATAYTFAAILSAVVIRRRLGGIEGRRIAAAVGRTLVAGGLTAGAAWLTARSLADLLGTATLGAQVVQVSAAVLAGLLVFVGVALMLRMEEVDAVKGSVMARLRR
ncbi:MAG: murein biosynthesis integral membrane protein MurJ [Actinobacteria bacterium]|nr:murein biosynthesis integral membrane protein MurJ [Actinomycetota bacterium]